MQIALSSNEYLNDFYVNEKDQITHVGNGLWISYEFLILFSINSERKFPNFIKHFPYYIYGKSYHKEKYEYLNAPCLIDDFKRSYLASLNIFLNDDKFKEKTDSLPIFKSSAITKKEN